MKCKYGQNGAREKLFRPNCPDSSECYEFELYTNADRIRAMSDEELASEMNQRSISTICDIVCQGDCKAIATLNKTSGEVCREIIMKWLQQPAVEDA